MGDETAGDDSAEEDDDNESFVWVPVEEDEDDAARGDSRTTDVSTGSSRSLWSTPKGSSPRAAGDSPETEEKPATTDSSDEGSSEEPADSDTQSIDIGSLIAENSPDEWDDGDTESEPRETSESSPQADEPASAASPRDREKDNGQQGRTESSSTDGQSDRLWNRYGSDTTDTTDTDRVQKSGESVASGDERDEGNAPAASDGDGATDSAVDSERSAESASTSDSGAAAGPAVGSDEPSSAGRAEQSEQQTRFDHLLERSDSGSSSVRQVDSPSAETDLDTLFSDLEEFGQATSGSQVLVISPEGHSITDEVCSRFLTASGAPERNAMFVTAVESPSERVDICRDCDDWAGGEVAVVEVGDTGPSSGDALEPVGGEDVIRKQVNSPKNLSKTGLLITQTLKRWSDRGQPPVLCFHTLTAISGYVDAETLFQFLFTLQAKLNSFGVTGHYHMDAGRHDQQEINTLKPLFDVVITVSRNGEVEVE